MHVPLRALQKLQRRRIVNEQPPEKLVSLLERLQLANRAQLLSVGRHVNRLANDLPRFESVWIDALAQARYITPYQAAELNAGRGMELAVGPFLLEQPLETSGWSQAFRAKDPQSQQLVRLTRARCSASQVEARAAALQKVVERVGGIQNPHVVVPFHCGSLDHWLWVASKYFDATTAQAWTVHHGRLPAETVLEIARQMTEGLAALEAVGLIHADVSAQSLLLGKNGGTTLVDGLLRGITRAEEGYAQADAPPEAYDYLAPERVTDGTSPDVSSDLYACGCLWWHLLAGRPPLAGGNRLAKLQAVQAPRIGDISLLAPDTPQPLASAIAACLRFQRSHRPESFARLSAMLGPSNKRDTATLAGLIRGDGPGRVRIRTTAATARYSRWTSVWVAATAGCAVSLAVTLWPQWSQYLKSEQLPGQAQSVPEAAAELETTVESSIGASEVEVQTGGALEPNKDPTSIEHANPPGLLPDTAGHARQVPLPPATASTAAYRSQTDGTLILPSDRPVAIERLSLAPGQLVTGPTGRRPQVVVPEGGLSIDTNGVRFVGIDFLTRPQAGNVSSTMIELRSERVTFEDCQFRGNSSVASTAIAWNLTRDAAAIALPTGAIEVSNCVFENVSTAVRCPNYAALSLTFLNTLHLGWGPLITLDDLPRADAPISVFADRLTVRDAQSFLECHLRSPISKAAPIRIEAVRSIFAHRAGNPLVVFVGQRPEEEPWHMVQWSGQGSVLDSPLPLVGWRSPMGEVESADEARLDVSGIVRGSIEFAGPTSRGPTGSRVVGWNAPLRSPDPPGFDPTGVSKLKQP